MSEMVPVFNPGEAVRAKPKDYAPDGTQVWTVLEQRYDREHIVIVRDNESTVRFFRVDDVERVEK